MVIGQCRAASGGAALSCTLCIFRAVPHCSLTRRSGLFLHSAEPRFQDAQAPPEFLTVTDDNLTQVCMPMGHMPTHVDTHLEESEREHMFTHAGARSQSDTMLSSTQVTLSPAPPRHSPPRLMLMLLPPALGLLLV